jgi:hypothetical protein
MKEREMGMAYSMKLRNEKITKFESENLKGDLDILK